MTISATAVQTTRDNPNSMIAIALENKADPEVLKKLMDLQERWEQNEARKEYMEAMAEFKRKAPAVLAKDLKVDFTSAKGRTHYNYAGLGGIVSQISSILAGCGLNASWETKQDKDSVSVTCHIAHSKGHRESTTLTGPMDDSGNKNRIQQIGSSVTYLQRYTLLALLGLATGNQDDDGKTDRQSVAMPTEKPALKQEPSGQEQPATANTVTGTLSQVTVKEGTGKKGAWKKWGLLVNAEWYGTFDSKIGIDAEDLKDQNVFLEWKPDGKYKTVTSIALCRDVTPASERQPGEDVTDDLPLDD